MGRSFNLVTLFINIPREKRERERDREEGERDREEGRRERERKERECGRNSQSEGNGIIYRSVPANGISAVPDKHTCPCKDGSI